MPGFLDKKYTLAKMKNILEERRNTRLKTSKLEGFLFTDGAQTLASNNMWCWVIKL
jgi:hypothetical protein